MILIPVILGLLLLEELLHRLNRGSFLRDIDLAGTTVERDEEADRGKLARFISWIRVLELLLFGGLFAVTAAYSGVKLMYTPAGQLTGLLLLMQIMRILNRKVINQWAVLGVTVILQGMILVLLLLTGLAPEGAIAADVHGQWIMSMASFVILFLLTVTMPFAGTYYLRLLSREGSGFYYFLPPLIYSEYWITRFTRITANLAVAILVVLAVLTVSYEYPLLPAVIHMVTVLGLVGSISLFRDGSRLHHPLAISLVVLIWITRIGHLLFEASSEGNGWIG
jgi:hypothetical protein